MSARIQHILHPDRHPVNTGQEMIEPLKKTFQGFLRANEGLSTSFRPRMQTCVKNPFTSDSDEPTKHSSPITVSTLIALFLKVLKTLCLYVSLSRVRKRNFFPQTSQTPEDWRLTIVTPAAKATSTTNQHQSNLYCLQLVCLKPRVSIPFWPTETHHPSPVITKKFSKDDTTPVPFILKIGSQT